MPVSLINQVRISDSEHGKQKEEPGAFKVLWPRREGFTDSKISAKWRKELSGKLGSGHIEGKAKGKAIREN